MAGKTRKVSVFYCFVISDNQKIRRTTCTFQPFCPEGWKTPKIAWKLAWYVSNVCQILISIFSNEHKEVRSGSEREAFWLFAPSTLLFEDIVGRNVKKSLHCEFQSSQSRLSTDLFRGPVTGK